MRKASTHRHSWRALLAASVTLLMTGCSEAPKKLGTLYDIGGLKLHMVCRGHEVPGQPTVIVENGSGVSTPLNYWLRTGLEQSVRVCDYDRVGMGWSDAADTPHDAATYARQLHALLQAANIKPPYVLAGHSIAGLILPVYTKAYPDEVVGLAYLDPSHPDQFTPELMEKFSEGKSQLRKAIWLARLGVLGLMSGKETGLENMLPAEAVKQWAWLTQQSKIYVSQRDEIEHILDSAHQAAEVTSLGDRPLVVISAKSGLEDGQIALHEQTAHLSSRGRHVVIDDANHTSLIADKRYAGQAVAEILNIVREAQANQ